MREELATVLSNRSVTFLEAGDFLSALVDAEHVITLKRQWSKGHFRKAKALIALQEHEEARDAINVGLQFEPKNAVRPAKFQDVALLNNLPQEMLNLLDSVERSIKESQS